VTPWDRKNLRFEAIRARQAEYEQLKATVAAIAAKVGIGQAKPEDTVDDGSFETQGVYNSQTDGPIPLSNGGRTLLQRLRSAVVNWGAERQHFGVNGYAADWSPVARARAAIAKRMGQLEAQLKQVRSMAEGLEDENERLSSHMAELKKQHAAKLEEASAAMHRERAEWSRRVDTAANVPYVSVVKTKTNGTLTDYVQQVTSVERGCDGSVRIRIA
jgi:hypothetical protein